MFSIFHLQITTSNTTFNNSNKAFNYYSLQQNFDGYTTLVDANNKVASFNEFYQGKIITKPESIASREVMTCTYVGWWSNGTFEPISELWCTSEGGSNGEDDGESGYNYGGGGTTSGTTEDQVINNLTGKALCVYNKLQAMSTNFKNMIQKFDGEFPVSHLKLIMEDLGTTRGVTRAPDGAGTSPDYVITIALNNNSNIHGVGYRPNLMTAKTITHEVIHAEMFRKLLSLAKQGNLNFTGWTAAEQKNYIMSIKDNFPGIYDYYTRYNWNTSTPNNTQHQQMATHYRETIADILQSFDNNQHSHQFYMDLAWEGLKYSNISTWSNLSQEEKDRIGKVIDDYTNANKNQNCQ